jgi:hypothetical protein
MRFALVRSVLVACGLGFTAPAAAQQLTVTRADGSSRVLGAAALAALPRVRGETLDHGDTLRYEGIALREVLRVAEAGPVDSLRGAALRRLVVLEGRDGYRIVLTLAELDATLGATQVVVVDRENGSALDAERGPMRIIVVGDSRASRWVRQISRITLVDFPLPAPAAR